MCLEGILVMGILSCCDILCMSVCLSYLPLCPTLNIKYLFCDLMFHDHCCASPTAKRTFFLQIKILKKRILPICEAVVLLNLKHM